MINFLALQSNGTYTCGDSGLSFQGSLPSTISMIILLIKIVVPILLIVFGMLDLAKAVMAQKEDEIKKGQQTFIKRLVAAIIFFFVIAIVKFAISAISKDNGDIISCMNCFIEGSKSTSCQVATTTNNNANKNNKPTV